MKKAYLIAGGEADITFLKSCLQHSDSRDILVGIDSGLRHLNAIGAVPDILVGDFDSADGQILERTLKNHREIKMHRHDPIKDATDTELAIDLAIRNGCDEIVIIGAFGGRLDHMLSNLFLCFRSEEAKICLLDECNKIYAIHSGHGEYRIYKNKQWGNYISFFPMFGEIFGLTIEGVRYPLYNKRLNALTEPTLTTSNEILDEFASIRFCNRSLLVVESRDKINGRKQQ